jgi:hypothetical protein
MQIRPYKNSSIRHTIHFRDAENFALRRKHKVVRHADEYRQDVAFSEPEQYQDQGTQFK